MAFKAINNRAGQKASPYTPSLWPTPKWLNRTHYHLSRIRAYGIKKAIMEI